MGARSVGAMIEARNVRRDHLFDAASEMTIGEVKSIAEIEHRLEKVRPLTEALEDFGDLGSAGISSKPSRVEFR